MKQKTIVMKSDEGFVAAFDSAKRASELSGVPYRTVRYNISGRKSRRNVNFKETMRRRIHELRRGKGRITQRDSDGTVVAVFADLDVAAKFTNVSPKVIHTTLNTQKLVGGYTFND